MSAVGNPLMCIYPHTIMLVCVLPLHLAANNHFFQLHYVGMSEPQQQGDLSEAADRDPWRTRAGRWQVQQLLQLILTTKLQKQQEGQSGIYLFIANIFEMLKMGQRD